MTKCTVCEELKRVRLEADRIFLKNRHLMNQIAKRDEVIESKVDQIKELNGFISSYCEKNENLQKELVDICSEKDGLNFRVREMEFNMNGFETRSKTQEVRIEALERENYKRSEDSKKLLKCIEKLVE